MAFAEHTTVPIERSRAEIESLVTRYGAEQFASGWRPNSATIGFVLRGRCLRFVVRFPDPTDEQFTHWVRGRVYKTKVRRSDIEAKRQYEQAIRRLWRALALTIKAKLESVESGIETFDEAFLAHIVMPDGRTATEIVRPWIDDAYATQTVPQLPGW